MGREIKFRVWGNNKMLSDDEIGGFAIDDLRNGLWNNVMQFTNLKDKNKVEIYEGDIVKILSSISVVEFGEQDIGHDWQGVGFYTRAESGEQFNIFGGDYIEVIGNIYENKEMIP